MKIYTHYLKADSTTGVRWRTLLQFGDSWDVIGTAVMKNPGSAAPLGAAITDIGILSQLAQFDDDEKPWYEFSADDTMRKVAVLFASYYGFSEVRELNGVIQIFNLFYVREANVETAKKLNSGLHEMIDFLAYDLRHLVHPVYLGFGSLAFSKEFTAAAREFFDAVMKSDVSYAYLNEKFERNKFYHPQWLCGVGLNNKRGRDMRGKFKQVPMRAEEIEKGVPIARWGR